MIPELTEIYLWKMGGDLGEHSMCFFNVHVYSVPIILLATSIIQDLRQWKK